MKKRFKKSMSFTSSIVILSAFGLITPSVYAYGRADNALNYGYGCHGDQACREERQARMGGANSYHRGQRNGKGMQAYHGNSVGRETNLTKIENSQLFPLSNEEKRSIEQMREEEKLARDVYITMYKKWGEKTFDNISKSEERHKEAVGILLSKYNLDDPIKDDFVGVFTSDSLQKLYNELVAKGNISLQEALKVGATIEDLDIYDLERFIANTKNPDVIEVYKKINNGSMNHMRAFTQRLDQYGLSYQPQYISNTRFTEILSEGNGNHMRGRRSIENMERNRVNINNSKVTKTQQVEQTSLFMKILSFFKSLI